MSTDRQLPESLETHLSYFISQGVTILQAPNSVPFLPPSRPDASGSKDYLVSRDTLFRYSLDGERTIPRYIGVYEDPFCQPTTTFSHPLFITGSASLVLELRDGVRGFNGTVHGGLICAIMDEAMGSLLVVNDNLIRQAKAKGSIPADAPGFTAAVTASINVKYRKPIPTPQIVVATASLDRVEGRKMYMHVVVKDQNEQECASCDGMFISISKGNL
ncbi:Thioesterase/thiol ester dehydrase-isomerase [Rostrohypoxylon terebratum]|nr:Thioesterase/thiol ester dehydrase-isomerase [Rostrohypoxylon terebratum]